VERAHTKSLDANDKLIQTRSHVRDTTASRKRQVIMRKVRSTIMINASTGRSKTQICVLVPLLCLFLEYFSALQNQDALFSTQATRMSKFYPVIDEVGSDSELGRKVTHIYH